MIQIIGDDSFEKFFIDLEEHNSGLDTIILQRDFFGKIKLDLKFVESFFAKLKKKDIKIIYDIDDNLLDIDENHISYNQFAKLNDVFKFILINSDIVTVSTQYLKEQLTNYNKNIVVIQNTLMGLWDFNSNKQIRNLNSKKTIKIGYFGTRSHGEDIKLLEKAITNIRQHFTNKNIIFEVVGVCPETYDWMIRKNIPRKYDIDLGFKDNIKNIIAYCLYRFNFIGYNLPYPSFVKWMKNEIDWDIAVAPLDDSNINRSKSNLKYLEYTALNVPGVYSDFGPYKEIGIKHTGLVVNNDSKDWEVAIINLIEDSRLYENILNNARNDIEKNYQVENVALIWKTIL